MLNGRNAFVTEEEYRINQAKIQQAQALIDSATAANEEGRQRYQDAEAILLQKMEEGRRAAYAAFDSRVLLPTY